MKQSLEKMPRPPSPRTQLRNAVMSSGRIGSQRPSSAKVAPTSERTTLRNLYSNKTRSNSARIPKPDPVVEKEDILDDPEAQEEHKTGCPWRKGRSRSKYRLNLTESSSGMLHPKPWGARNPNEIPCFCKLSRGPRDCSRGPLSRSPTRLQDFMSRHERQASRSKVTEIVAALCAILDRKKVKISDIEMTMLLEKVKEKLQKYKDQTAQSQQKPTQKPHSQQKQPTQDEKKSPGRRPRTVQSLSPVPQHANYAAHGPASKENLGDQPRNQGPPLLRKLETEKYYVELTSEDQVPPGLKHFMGIMSTNAHARPEKQVVLMDDQYGLPDEMRQYTVMNTGVQLRHHAENTTLLLGNQGIVSAARLKALPPGTMIQGRHALPQLNAKPRRV